MKMHFLAFSCVTALASGCIKLGGAVDLTQMEVAIGAATSLGHSATLAMNAMTGTTACTQVTQRCTTYPCSGSVMITLGPNCPLPLGGTATGTVMVTGMWTSATQATLSAQYVNVQAGTRNTVVTSSTSITATPTSVMYTGQNVQVHGGSALAAQSTWNVSVDRMGRYTISGTQQAGGGGGSAFQLDVSNVIVDPGTCWANPVGGQATIQDVSGLSISTATVSFHTACDGKADADGTPVMVDFLAK
jgi:hypothetical protein